MIFSFLGNIPLLFSKPQANLISTVPTIVTLRTNHNPPPPSRLDLVIELSNRPRLVHSVALLKPPKSCNKTHKSTALAPQDRVPHDPSITKTVSTNHQKLSSPHTSHNSPICRYEEPGGVKESIATTSVFGNEEGFEDRKLGTRHSATTMIFYSEGRIGPLASHSDTWTKRRWSRRFTVLDALKRQMQVTDAKNAASTILLSRRHCDKRRPKTPTTKV